MIFETVSCLLKDEMTTLLQVANVTAMSGGCLGSEQACDVTCNKDLLYGSLVLCSLTMTGQNCLPCITQIKSCFFCLFVFCIRHILLSLGP